MRQKNKIVLTPEQEQYLRDNYATVIHHTLCERLGISTRTLVRMARARGLKKDMNAIEGQRLERLSKALRHTYLVKGFKGKGENGIKTRFQPGYKAKEFFGEEKFNEMHRKAVETRKRTLREERARATFGLPQKTNLRVIRQPRQKIYDRCYLKKRGYILDEQKNIAYWTPDTQRATVLEARPKRFYTFMPYGEIQ